MSSVVDDICELLNSYNGRDKVVRLACYAAKLYGCMTNNDGWKTAGSKLSATRMTLRLFDDVPTTRYTISYGLGKNESSKASAFLGLISNVVDQVFLPVEKALWLHEVGVLKLGEKTADSLDLLSTTLWAGGLYISLLQTLGSMRHHLWSRSCLRKSENGGSELKKNLDIRLVLEIITVFKLLLDITHAVSCLPQGYLWGERIGNTKIAAIATTSSVIGISMYFAKKRLLR